jgi:alkylation response protein AidB-like acyl-CoA dehydrogenase
MSVHSSRGGDDCMTENPIAWMCVDARVERIHAGANEIMMEMTGSSR